MHSSAPPCTQATVLSSVRCGHSMPYFKKFSDETVSVISLFFRCYECPLTSTKLDPHASPPSYERLSPGVPPSAPLSELEFCPQHNLHHSDVIFISANRSTSSIGSCVAAAICSILSLPRPINALAVDLADSARPLASPSANPSRRKPFISLT